ncbi:MAG: hypothetical protein P3X22_006490 [Thermoprotei archaeon]|nr:hypothetical protein [Thermoprotei archaeon]
MKNRVYKRILVDQELPEECRGILPEDYFFESKCDAVCFCKSKSLDEYLECAARCFAEKTRDRVGEVSTYTED